MAVACLWVCLLCLALTPVHAEASTPTRLELDVPSPVTTGSTLRVTATLVTDDGQPVPSQTLQVRLDQGPWVETQTNQTSSAQPRLTMPDEPTRLVIQARFDGNRSWGPSEARLPVDVRVPTTLSVQLDARRIPAGADQVVTVTLAEMTTTGDKSLQGEQVNLSLAGRPAGTVDIGPGPTRVMVDLPEDLPTGDPVRIRAAYQPGPGSDHLPSEALSPPFLVLDPLDITVEAPDPLVLVRGEPATLDGRLTGLAVADARDQAEVAAHLDDKVVANPRPVLEDGSFRLHLTAPSDAELTDGNRTRELLLQATDGTGRVVALELATRVLARPEIETRAAMAAPGDTSRIQARLVDDRGAAIGDARVDVMHGNQTLATQWTAADGTLTFDLPVPQEATPGPTGYRLAYRPPPGAPYLGTDQDADLVAAHRTAIRVAGGSLAPGTPLAGSVVAEGPGTPTGRVLATWDGDEQTSADLGPDGRFSLDQPPGLATGRTAVALSYEPDAGAFLPATTQVMLRLHPPVDLAIEPNPLVAGEPAHIRARFTQELGIPAGASVEVHLARTTLATAELGDAGAVWEGRLPDLDPGDHGLEVRVTGPGLDPVVFEEVVPVRRPAAIALDLDPLEGGLLEATVRLTSPTEGPIPDARVCLATGDLEAPCRTTDRSGTARFELPTTSDPVAVRFDGDETYASTAVHARVNAEPGVAWELIGLGVTVVAALLGTGGILWASKGSPRAAGDPALAVGFLVRSRGQREVLDAYAELRRRLDEHGLTRADHETLRDLHGRLRSRLDLPRWAIRDLTRGVEAARYGEQLDPGTQARALAALDLVSRRLERPDTLVGVEVAA